MNDIVNQITSLKNLETEWQNLANVVDTAISVVQAGLLNLDTILLSTMNSTTILSEEFSLLADTNKLSFDTKELDDTSKTVKELYENIKGIKKETPITIMKQDVARIAQSSSFSASISKQRSKKGKHSKSTETYSQTAELSKTVSTSLQMLGDESVKATAQGDGLINNYLTPALDIMSNVRDVAGGLGIDMNTLSPVIDGLSNAIAEYNSIMSIGKIKIGEFTIAEWLLNSAFLANPIVWVIGAILALIGVIVYAWKHFAGFREVVSGLWSAFKETFSAIADMAKKILGGVWDLISGVFTFDKDKIKQGWSELKEGIKSVGPLTQKIGVAYEKGVQDRKIQDGVKQQAGAVNNPSADAIATKNLLPPVRNYSTQKTATKANGYSSASDSITNGGKKMITININKSFVENFTINAKEVKEGYDNLKLRVEEIFLEILNSANAVGA